MDHGNLVKVLHTRRFWVALVSAGLVIVNDGLGIDIPPQTVMPFAGIIISFLLGDAYVQGKHVTQVPDKTSNKAA